MADRNWDKELAKVDKQLASLSDEAPVQPAGGAKGGAPAKGSSKGASVSADTGDVSGRARWGMYARVTLSVALGVGMVIWPYEARCGFGLAGYLAAVVVVITSGVWSSIWTWRHRASRSHALSLLIVLWGLILGAIEVLPRIGYAKPDLRHPAAWTCSAPATPTPTPPKPPTK
ncbi:MAG: hypothetical protein ACREPM_21230 [Gemmatimonadaceae bacterium]